MRVHAWARMCGDAPCAHWEAHGVAFLMEGDRIIEHHYAFSRKALLDYWFHLLKRYRWSGWNDQIGPAVKSMSVRAMIAPADRLYGLPLPSGLSRFDLLNRFFGQRPKNDEVGVGIARFTSCHGECTEACDERLPHGSLFTRGSIQPLYTGIGDLRDLEFKLRALVIHELMLEAEAHAAFFQGYDLFEI